MLANGERLIVRALQLHGGQHARLVTFACWVIEQLAKNFCCRPSCDRRQDELTKYIFSRRDLSFVPTLMASSPATAAAAAAATSSSTVSKPRTFTLLIIDYSFDWANRMFSGKNARLPDGSLIRVAQTEWKDIEV